MKAEKEQPSLSLQLPPLTSPIPFNWNYSVLLLQGRWTSTPRYSMASRWHIVLVQLQVKKLNRHFLLSLCPAGFTSSQLWLQNAARMAFGEPGVVRIHPKCSQSPWPPGQSWERRVCKAQDPELEMPRHSSKDTEFHWRSILGFNNL